MHQVPISVEPCPMSTLNSLNIFSIFSKSGCPAKKNNTKSFVFILNVQLKIYKNMIYSCNLV